MPLPPNLAPLFEEGGVLAKAIPGYRFRQEQLEFAEEVRKAIEGSGQLIAEAGTGTGKTFAYLVPALLAGGKVIISTGTKTLQDQLYHRDLPRVRAALGVSLTTSLLKGRANYVCLHHLEGAGQGTFGSREEIKHLAKIRSFAQRTMTGDRAECSDVPEGSSAWALATSTRDNCLGSGCRHYQECFVMKARKRAAEADVIVVNHHLFFADVALRDEGAADLLPSANTIVFDEAHHLPDLARLFFGETISTTQAIELARDVRFAQAQHAREGDTMGEAADDMETAARDIRIALGNLLGRQALASLRTRREFDGALAAFEVALERLHDALAAQEERADEIRNCRERVDVLLGRVSQWREADARPKEDAFGDPMDEPGVVRWVESYPQSAVLYMTPLDVARIFQKQITDGKRAWIFTSATLSVNGDFSHYQREMGLDAAATNAWASPFDYQRQALLYVPQGLPDPNSERYVEAVIEAAWPVLRASGGHAFVLFTSLRAMDRGHDLLARKLEDEGRDWPLMLQGGASKNELLERFRRSPNAILVGSQSFWEGVDVKGEQLSVVVIDRLPFNPPDDPVLAACIERINRAGGNAFMDYQLPRAVITLKQGAGRLIRDETDRGALVICDPRLVDKPYGKRIWRALPPFRRTRDLADVEAFFRVPAEAVPG